MGSGGSGNWRRHAFPVGLLFVVAIWMMRHLLFSNALPAGTDMLDLLARTRQNASGGALLNPWAPTGFGLPRQTSLDNLLGLITLITGSATRTVKLVMLLLFVGAGASAYWLVWKWYRSVFAAAIAGLLYMTSQALLGRLASGWLHYAALIALTPVVLYLGVALIDRFAVRDAILLALVLGGLVLARPDMMLWVLPYLGFYVAIKAATERPGVVAANVLKAAGVVTATLLILTAFVTIPLLAGIRAPWLSAGEVFQQIRFNLIDRSLTPLQSVLGLGRDMGYLPFSGQEWWKFHPYLPMALYYGSLGIVVVCAWLALTIRRDRRTLFLVACGTVAPFLAKGIRDPLGGPYWWAVQHIPIFGNLRGPNRWLIVGTLAYAVLTGITLQHAAAWLVARLRAGGHLSPKFGYAPIVALLAVVLLPVAPTLRSGFLTWQPSPGEMALMHVVEDDPSRFMVASVPYDQPMNFVTRPDYSGWEHDLGVESALWTGHPALSTNGWSRGESDFVDYTESLLRSRDPAFASMLGASSVKYILKFDYLPSAPYLIAKAGESPLYQQHAVETMQGLSKVMETPGGALYTVRDASPIVSFRPNIAVILGGRSGLAQFADLPGINSGDWASFTADDLLTGRDGSIDRLVQYLHSADLILATDDTTQDLATLATPPLARIPGISSDPGLDRQGGLLLTDESARMGSLADQSIPPPGLVASSTQAFTVTRPGNFEVWTRVMFSTTPGAVTYSVDGRPADSLIPLTPGHGGFRWVRVATDQLEPGRHEIRVAGGPSQLGSTFEVDETRLIDPAVRTRILSRLEDELQVDRQKIAYSLDLSAAQYEGLNGVAGTASTAGYPIEGGATSPFWHATSRLGAASSDLRNQDGEYQRFQLTGPRPYYAFAYHAFHAPQSWQGRDSLLIPYRGTGSGTHYNFIVDFNKDHTDFASWPIIDSKAGWQVAMLPIPGHPGNWDHVVSIRLATASKQVPDILDLGPARWLFPQEVAVNRDLATSQVQQPRTTGAESAAGVSIDMRKNRAGVTVLRAVIPTARTYEPLRVVVMPGHPLSPMPATPVNVLSDGVARFDVSFDASRDGVLVFNQANDSHWRLSTSGTELRPSARVASLTNGFLVPAGRYSATLEFAGRRLPAIGAGIAILSSVALALELAFISFKRRRRQRTAESPQTDVEDWVAEYPIMPANPLEVGRWRPGFWTAVIVLLTIAVVGQVSFAAGVAILVILAAVLRPSWQLPLGVALILVVLTPFLSGRGFSDFADLLAMFAVVLMAITLVLAIGQSRRASASSEVLSGDAAT